MSGEPDFVEEYRKRLPSVTPDIRDDIAAILDAAAFESPRTRDAAIEALAALKPYATLDGGELLTATYMTGEQEIRRDALQMATGLIGELIETVSDPITTGTVHDLALLYAKSFADFITTG